MSDAPNPRPAAEKGVPRRGRVRLTGQEREAYGIRAKHIDGDDVVFLESDVERIVTERLRRVSHDAENGALLTTIERLVAEAHERGYSLDALLTRTYDEGYAAGKARVIIDIETGKRVAAEGARPIPPAQETAGA